jgi:hypothetical protein
MIRLPLPSLVGRRDPPTVPVNDSLGEYVDWLRGSSLRRLNVSKAVSGEIPDGFSRSRLASRPEGALASYRDRRRRDSVHIVEYPDRWEIHVDRFNPRYEPLGHVLVDAPEQTAREVASLTGLDDLFGLGRRVARVGRDPDGATEEG